MALTQRALLFFKLIALASPASLLPSMFACSPGVAVDNGPRSGGTGSTLPTEAGGAVGGSLPQSGTTGKGVFSVEAKLASDLKSSSPGTVGIVTWSVDVSPIVEAHIDFGLDTNYGMQAPVDLAQPNYRTVLLGMKPSHPYHYRIVASDGKAKYTSIDYQLTTGPKTTLVSLGSYTVKSPSAHQRGFIITSYWQGKGGTVPFIIDGDGDIVWWWQAEGSLPLSRARMSADSKNMWMVVADLDGGPVQRVTMDTLDSQSYPAVASHDICAWEGETMLYVDYAGDSCDGVVRIDPSGKTQKVFDSSPYVSKTGGTMGCHGNAIRYSKSEPLFTYSDWQQDVLFLDTSFQVQWRLSDRTGGNKAWGGTNHGNQILNDGTFFLFANTGAGSQASTVYHYKMDGELIKKFPSAGYSMNFGDVQLLPNGGMLFDYSNASFMQEVDPDGNVVMQLDGGGASFGYAEWRQSLYGAALDVAE